MLPFLLLVATVPHVNPLQLLPKNGSHLSQIIEQVLNRSPRPLQASVSQQEINEYALEFVRSNPTCGLSHPNIKVFPSNYVSLYGEVNLDQVGECLPQWRRRLARLPLRGRHTLLLDGTFSAEAGQLTARIVKARLDGRYVSPTLLNLGLRFLAVWKEGRYNFASGAHMPFGLIRAWTQNAALFFSAS